MVFTLYKLDASPPVRAVLMTIEALDISSEAIYVDVDLLNKDHLTEKYLQMNPQHTIPTLVDSDGFTLWDSHAITTYLVNTNAKNGDLYPTDFKKRALIDQRLHFDSGILFPALRGTVEPVIFRGETSYRPENLAKITSAYEFTEKFLSSSSLPWLAGDDVTLADICCVASISSLDVVVPIDENLYPKLTAWWNRCADKDFYVKGNVPGLEQFAALLKSKIA